MEQRLRGLRRGVLELLEALTGPIVHAVRAQHVELLQAQVLLDFTYGLDLASDSDEEHVFHPSREAFQRGQRAQVRGQARLNPSRSHNVRHRSRLVRTHNTDTDTDTDTYTNIQTDKDIQT